MEQTLAILPETLPPDGGILWQGRSDKKEIICLEAELEKRLLRIREKHMLWAYQTGKQKIGDASLSQKLEAGATPSMWWTSLIYERHPKLSPNLYTIYKLVCLELLLQETGTTSLQLRGGDRKLKKAVKQLCTASGIDFSFVRGGHEERPVATGLLRRLYQLMPAPLRAITRFAHWEWKIRSKLRPAVALPPLKPSPDCAKPAATITTYFPNIDLRAAGERRFRSRYWENLHGALNAEAERERPAGGHFVRWLLIRFPSPDLSFDECLRLRDLFQKEGKDGLSFNFLEEFLHTKDLWRATTRWLRLCCKALTLAPWFSRHCRFAGSNVDFWPYMREEWHESLAGWRSLERCLTNRAFRRYCQMAGEQRWHLFPLENCPWERMLTLAAHECGEGPVYGAQHSTVRPTDFRYFDAPETFVDPVCAVFQPDRIAGNGASACDQWLQNQMPAARLCHVEALRYLYLGDLKQRKHPAALLPSQANEPLEPDKGKRLLVLTSFFKDETEAHLRLLQAALTGDLLRPFRIILKPHPYLQPQAWLANLPESQRDRIFVSHAPLGLEFSEGTIVWASNSTTGALEAALRRIPLLVMAPHNDFDLCPIQNVPCLLRTATLDDLRTGLQKLAPLNLEPDYLDLRPGLQAWRKLLDLKA